MKTREFSPKIENSLQTGSPLDFVSSQSMGVPGNFQMAGLLVPRQVPNLPKANSWKARDVGREGEFFGGQPKRSVMKGFLWSIYIYI